MQSNADARSNGPFESTAALTIRNPPVSARATVHDQRTTSHISASASVAVTQPGRPTYALLEMELDNERRLHTVTCATVADFDGKNRGHGAQIKQLSADLVTANRHLQQQAGCRDAFVLGHAKLKEAREATDLEQAARVAAEAACDERRARVARARTNDDDKDWLAGQLLERIDTPWHGLAMKMRVSQMRSPIPTC